MAAPYKLGGLPVADPCDSDANIYPGWPRSPDTKTTSTAAYAADDAYISALLGVCEQTEAQPETPL